MPYRPNNAQRQRIWEYNKRLWDDLPVEMCVAEDTNGDGVFSFSKLCNQAFRMSTGENVLIYGVDHIPPTEDHLTEIEELLTEHPWIPAFLRTDFLTQRSTAHLLSGRQNPRLTYRTDPLCTGVLALTRATYLESGGMDERFIGWGWQDAAFRKRLTLQFGTPPDATRHLTSLWHPLESREHSATNEALFREI